MMDKASRDLYQDHLIQRYGQEAWLRAMSTLSTKVIDAVDCLRHRVGIDNTFVGHSGGKDSVVVNFLAQHAGFMLPVVHTPKVEGRNKVHPLTVAFLYEQTLTYPITFCTLGQIKHQFPGVTTQIDGTRIAEHDRTDGRSTHVVIDGEDVPRDQMTEYVANGLNGMSFIYPIYNWEDVDVWACIYAFSIPFSPEYLDEMIAQ
jgi:3'-phosphoadenosine 5'-phosphosulfate sulfotransferase (PAPS reductase)/FAD synthetase